MKSSFWDILCSWISFKTTLMLQEQQKHIALIVMQMFVSIISRSICSLFSLFIAQYLCWWNCWNCVDVINVMAIISDQCNCWPPHYLHYLMALLLLDLQYFLYEADLCHSWPLLLYPGCRPLSMATRHCQEYCRIYLNASWMGVIDIGDIVKLRTILKDFLLEKSCKPRSNCS